MTNTGGNLSASFLIIQAATPVVTSQCSDIMGRTGVEKIQIKSSVQCVGQVKVYVNDKLCTSCKVELPDQYTVSPARLLRALPCGLLCSAQPSPAIRAAPACTLALSSCCSLPLPPCCIMHRASLT